MNVPKQGTRNKDYNLNFSVYRASFRQTYAELNAPTGEWKFYVAAIMLSLIVTGWMVMWMEKFGMFIRIRISLVDKISVDFQ